MVFDQIAKIITDFIREAFYPPVAFLVHFQMVRFAIDDERIMGIVTC